VLLALIEPGDEVVLTRPTYVGLVNRVRLAGGVPRFARLVPGAQVAAGSRFIALGCIAPDEGKAFLMMSSSIPTDAKMNPIPFRHCRPQGHARAAVRQVWGDDARSRRGRFETHCDLIADVFPL
jgi:hypothetical protein